MQSYLNSNQVAAIDKLSRLKVGALFMDMGTGKTRTAVELVRATPCDLVLWICPFNTKANLLQEIQLSGGLQNLRIEGIESIQQSDRVYLEVLAEMQGKSVFVVCDESIKIKNSQAKRTKRLFEIAKHSEYRLILNGTPITRNLLDIWAQMEFLSPKILKMGLAEFENKYCEVVTIKKNQNGKRSERTFIDGYHNIDHLYSLISPYIFECDLSLSVEQNYHEAYYSLSCDEKEEYDKIKGEFLTLEAMQGMNNNIFIAMTQKMQHSYCLASDKFRCLESILSKHNSEDVLVFTKYIDSSEELKKRYPKLQVLSFAKHSFGLNLQHKFVTVYWDKTFDYGLMVQSEARTYRQGQQKDCIYYSMSGNVGLEQMIEKNINNKQSLLDYFKKVGIEQISKEL